MVFSDVKKYVKDAKKLPNTVTCNNVKKLCADKLAVAKISFFASVSAMHEPFLKTFQTPSPLAPFLYDDIAHLLRSLMTRDGKYHDIFKNIKNIKNIGHFRYISDIFYIYPICLYSKDII